MFQFQGAKQKWNFLAAAGFQFLAASVCAQQYLPVTSLPIARVKHGSTIVQDHLYVIAGDSAAGFTASVQSAKINHDRTLGPWSDNRELPVNLIDISGSVFSVGDTIFVCGGQIVDESNAAANYGKKANSEIYYSTATKDGALGPWLRSNPWPSEATVGTGAVSDGITIYIVGGQTVDGAVSNKVYYAELGFDGSIAAWKETKDLLEPLAFHNVLFHAGKLYVIGGKVAGDEEKGSDRVYETVVQPDGSLGDWALSENKLEHAVYGAAGCASDAYFFLFCGKTSGYDTLSMIQYAQQTPTGITKWGSVVTDIPSRTNASVVLDPFRRALYIAGGQSSLNYLDVSSGVFCYPLVGTGASQATQPETAYPVETAFMELPAALKRAELESQNMMILFYSNNVPASVTMKDTLSQSSSFFKEIGENALPVAVEIFEDSELAVKYSISRVPTFVLVKPDLTQIRSEYGFLTQQQIVELSK